MPTMEQSATQQLIDQLLSGRSSGQGLLSGSNIPIPNLQATGPVSQFPRVAAPISGFGGYAPMVTSGAVSPLESLAAQVSGSGLKAKTAGLLGGVGRSVAQSPAGKLFAGTGGGKFMKFARPSIPLIAANFLANPLSEAVGGNESVLGRFTKGAAYGGGGGALLGPWGAAGGALVGGVGNALGLFGGGGGDKGPDIEDLLEDAPLSVDAKERLRLTYDILKETGDKKQANSIIGEMILEELNTSAVEAKATEDSQRRMLATQALTAQFFQPFTKQLLDSAQMRHKMTQDLLPSLPESYRGIAAQQSIAALDDSTRMANAYAAQAQLIPTMSAMQQQQSGVNQIAQQLFQQGLQGAMGGGAAGGAGSFNDLLAQLTPAG